MEPQFRRVRTSALPFHKCQEHVFLHKKRRVSIPLFISKPDSLNTIVKALFRLLIPSWSYKGLQLGYEIFELLLVNFGLNVLFLNFASIEKKKIILLDW